MKPERVRSPVWPLLWRFSWPEWRHHRARHATAVLAVLLGVALAFSVHLINASALSEFSAAVRAVNGQADLSVHAAHGGLDEAWYPRLVGHRLVRAASPVVDVRTLARPGAGEARALRVIGLDPLVAAPLTPALLPQLAASEDRLQLFAPDAISLNAAAMRAFGVRAGQTLAVQSGLRWQLLRVVGQVAEGGEPLGVMDIAGAQDLFMLSGQITRVDLRLQTGVGEADVRAALALPSGVLAEAPAETGTRVSNVSRAYRVNLTVLALVALFTGAFLVFSILSLSVAKRQQQFALLGVLGLSARERLQLVLAESAVVGTIGAGLGLLLGTGLAAAALRLLAGDLGGGYFPGIAPRLQWSPMAASMYGALGVLAAMAGGWLPARQAQALAPAQALKGQGDVRAQGAWRGVGPALLVLGALLARLPAVGGVPLWAYVSVACLLVGGVACVPLVTGLVLGLWPRAWLARSAATMLAVERVQRMRHTATVVMAGVVASLSLCVALTVMVASFRGSVSAWLDVVLPADLYARTTRNGAGTDALHLSDAVLRDVAHVPGVLRVAGLRVSTLSLRADQPPIDLIARDLGVDARTGADAAPQRLPLVGVVAPHVPGHIEVYVSEAMVDLHGARVGQDLALPLLPGQAPVSVRVRGVWRDYARQQGAIVLALSDYQRLTGDHAINDLALWLAPSARTSEVEQAIRARVDAQGLSGAALTFAEPREIRTTTLRIFDRSFAVTYWLQAVAIGIGLFGTAASFSTQVLARRKEFGLLRHLGVARAQVLGIVGAEGLALSAVGAALGLALGMLVSVVLVKVVNPQSFHWTMDLLWPWPRLLALCGGVIVAGTLTALLAGRAAIGQDAVLAVKEDW